MPEQTVWLNKGFLPSWESVTSCCSWWRWKASPYHNSWNPNHYPRLKAILRFYYHWWYSNGEQSVPMEFKDICNLCNARWASYHKSILDMVFDVHKPSSLKAETRPKQGNGVRRRETGETKIPSNWWNILRENENKPELFKFMANKTAHVATPNVIVSKEVDAASNHTINLAGWYHAVTKMLTPGFLCMPGMQQKWAAKSSWLKPVTDIVITTVTVMQALQELGLQQLWIAFGQGQNLG